LFSSTFGGLIYLSFHGFQKFSKKTPEAPATGTVPVRNIDNTRNCGYGFFYNFSMYSMLLVEVPYGVA
jgi:hypothetical protein